MLRLIGRARFWSVGGVICFLSIFLSVSADVYLTNISGNYPGLSGQKSISSIVYVSEVDAVGVPTARKIYFVEMDGGQQLVSGIAFENYELLSTYLRCSLGNNFDFDDPSRLIRLQNELIHLRGPLSGEVSTDIINKHKLLESGESVQDWGGELRSSVEGFFDLPVFTYNGRESWKLEFYSINDRAGEVYQWSLSGNYQDIITVLSFDRTLIFRVFE